MARPIKETPILTGKDAARFMKNIAQSEKAKVSDAEMARIRANFNKFKLVNE